MSVPSENQASWPQAEAQSDASVWADHGSDFVLISEGRPPSRIELARERMLICRLYLGSASDHNGRLRHRVCRTQR